MFKNAFPKHFPHLTTACASRGPAIWLAVCTVLIVNTIPAATAAALQLVEGQHPGRGRWFLIAILLLLLIGGILLLARAFRDLRREEAKSKGPESSEDDQTKAA